MQIFINFLVNNYLWFLVISLILIFALIGYLVDVNEKKEKPNSEIDNTESNIINLETNEEKIDSLNNIN